MAIQDTSLHAIIETARRHPGAVLGTVVDVQGSAYRRPGARVLVMQDGQRAGMISGGCLDRDVGRQARAWTEEGPTLALYDTRGDALHPQGAYGSGCDGVVQIWLERVDTPGTRCVLDLARRAFASREQLTVATVYDGEGATWRAAKGARVAMLGDEFLGDARLPASVQDALAQVLDEARGWRWPRSVEVATGEGGVRALVERVDPPLELLVVGAGDDARPLVAMAASMGWVVHVVDRWPALTTTARFPGAASVRCVAPEALLEHVTPTPWTHVVMMTHSFNDDLKILPALLRTEAPWIGLMGPRRRTMNLMRALAQRGELPDAGAMERVQTPVGVELNAESPEEVALSVLAGLVAARNGASGGLLRDRAQASIHPEHQRLRVVCAPEPSEEAS